MHLSSEWHRVACIAVNKASLETYLFCGCFDFLVINWGCSVVVAVIYIYIQIIIKNIYRYIAESMQSSTWADWCTEVKRRKKKPYELVITGPPYLRFPCPLPCLVLILRPVVPTPSLYIYIYIYIHIYLYI
jgi:hypothetical protein